MPEDYDFRPALTALDVPVLVVQGDDDYLPAATWTDDVPGVERVEVSEAGHVPYIDRPDRVRELVLDFVLAVASER
jgi:pimeloyl-ACP methyl ester carboxylesterase